MKTRLESVKNIIRQEDLDAFFISSLSNLFYLTGFAGFQEAGDAYCLITKKKNYLFTHRLYIHEIEALQKDFVLCEISPEKRLSLWLKEITASEKLEDIGVEEDDISLFSFQQLEAIEKVSWHASSLYTLRGIKDMDEIEHIKKACKLTDEAFSFLLKTISVGITEIELQYKLKEFAATHQTDNAFEPVVAFGANSALPHHSPNQTKLAETDVILLDFGMKYQGYCADMSRTIFIGSIDEKVKDIYQTVLQAHKASIEKINFFQKMKRPIEAAVVDAVSREVITGKGYSDYPHALGHGIGIEVHEYPVLYPRAKENLEHGMVVAIEPAVYIPGFIGIRIEDNVIITDNGPEIITHSSKELIVL